MSDVTEIRDDIYDITVQELDDGRRYRAYLVDGPTPTLFDTGKKSWVDSLTAGIEETEITPERVVITHADGDHAGGLEGIVERFDPVVWASEQSTLDAVEPDKRYDDGSTVASFEALHLPGHKSDSYAFVDEGRGVVISGDVVNGADQRGFPEGYLVLPPAVYSTDLIELENNLERLLDFSFSTVLVYHGSSVLENGKRRLEEFIQFPGKPGSN